MRIKVTILFLLAAFTGRAQSSDSVALSLGDVYTLAKVNHPIIKQARLQDDMAVAELLFTKGQFDPKIQSNYNVKNLNETEYYEKFNNTLKIPTWFPLDPKVEVYRNQGEYINPESYVSSSQDYWQVSAGVSLPIGKGLFIDERRMLVTQAQLFSGLAEVEKIKLINKTLLTISKSYWDWYLAYKKYELTASAIEIAQEVLARTNMDYEYGEAAVVDTIQAKITYQSRQTDFEKAKLELLQSKLALSVHLWSDEGIPLELSNGTFPVAETSDFMVPTDSGFQRLVEWALSNHPDLRKLNTKREQLEVEQRWNRESLKPELNLSYSLIDAPFNNNGYETPDWDNNYKLGVDFSIPILLRKERGKLQKNRVYQEQIEFEMTQTRLALSNQLKSIYAELKTNQILAKQFSHMSRGYRLLFEAEVFNLESGESDLFKLNIQQEKYIGAQIKALEALVKFEKMRYQLPYEVGLPNLSYQELYE
ncbi:TolC family protein [Marinoscillum sp.]|uniref:TolC family protein n=1 Tax=Marinoscillum sp. TaxID=2024838 RepID=UPI003BACC5B5